MSAPIAGFVCALVLAALVVVWIAYCMFFRERHKSEYYQYNISDIRHRNYVMSQEQEILPEKKLTAGIFILPSRHQQKDEEYANRPDYPESPVPVPGDKLADIFNDNIDADVHYKDGIYEVESCAPYHSDV